MAIMSVVSSRVELRPTGEAISVANNEFSTLIIDGFVGPANKTLLGKNLTEYGTVQPMAYPNGYGRGSAATGGFGFPCDLSPYSAVTVVFEYSQRSLSGLQVLLEHTADFSTTQGGFVVYTDSSSNLLIIASSPTAGTSEVGYITIPALLSKTTIALRMRFGAGNADSDFGLSINGSIVPVGAYANSATAAYFKNDSTYFLGRAGYLAPADAIVGGYAVLNGFLSDRQLNSLSSDPWQIFKDPTLRVPILSMGIPNPTSYTLTCNSGTYNTLGKTATLSVSRRLVCATGTYTTSGKAAALPVARTLVCAAGTYATSGKAATLRVVHTLVCATGTYTTSGKAATLTVVHNYILTCSPGSYTSSGKAATLSYVPGAVSYTLTCSSGVYVFSGKDATLTYVSHAPVDYALICESGIYAVSGKSATLLYVSRALLVSDPEYIIYAKPRSFKIKLQKRTFKRDIQKRPFRIKS